MIVHVGPEWEPFAFTEENYDAVTSRHAATPYRPVPAATSDAVRCGCRTRRLIRTFLTAFYAVPRPVCYFIGLMLFVLIYTAITGDNVRDAQVQARIEREGREWRAGR